MHTAQELQVEAYRVWRKDWRGEVEARDQRTTPCTSIAS